MENISTYIESGILELYALNQLNPQEKYEVEKTILGHPEFQRELEKIELSLEKIAVENAITPSENTKLFLLQKIDFLENAENDASISKKNIAFNHIQNRLKIYKIAFAACFTLLVLSIVLLLKNYATLADTRQELLLVNAAKNQTVVQVHKLQFSNDGLENMLAMTQNTEWKTVALKSTQKNQELSMLVYWNDKNAEVVLNYCAMNLPEIDTNYEFQLWAIVEGKPKSLGVFSSTSTASKPVISMEKTDKAQGFAVTIEPLGGSEFPTIEKMIVKGDLI